MRIGVPSIVPKEHDVTYSVAVESLQGAGTLWFSVDSAHADLLSTTADAALLGLLLPAMFAGEDVHIDGTVSERLYYHLSFGFQKLLLAHRPWLKPVRIIPARLESVMPDPGAGVATGFSGGIDSFCVLADHFYGDVPASMKLTHLLFNNVGSHGGGGERLFLERYERLLPTARQMGLPFIKVNSNLPQFYPKKLSWRQTHSFRNASVALLLQGGIRRYLYASTFDFPAIKLAETQDSAYSDMVTLPMLSTDRVDLFSMGSGYSRVGKTLRVAEVPDSYGALDVCVNSHNDSGRTNRSRCWKCLRTLATFEAAGKLDHYAGVFDLEVWRDRRDDFLASLPRHPNPLMRELLVYARQQGVQVPAAALLRRYSGITWARDLSLRLSRQGPGRA